MPNFSVVSFDRHGAHVYPFYGVKAALATFRLLSSYPFVTRVVLQRTIRPEVSK